MNKHLNTASDEAIVKLITAQRDMYQTLLKKHPAAVAKFELNQLDDSIFDLEDLYSGFLTQIQKVEAEVILSGNTAKSPIDTTLAKKN